MIADDARTADVLHRARHLADEVLFPAALQTDRARDVPREQLDRLAEAGLYGAAGPASHDGLDLSPAALAALVELLAGGCLTTTFIWLQHHGLVRALREIPPSTPLSGLLPELCRGERRAGIVFAGLIPGVPRLRASPRQGGWRLDGTADWVTGWRHVDVLLVLARGPDETLVRLALDATPQPGVIAERRELVAVDASATVSLRFDGVRVARERLIGVEPFDPDAHASGEALRLNGSLALGITARACRMLGPGPLDEELDACRRRLRDGPGEEVADARAAASALAVRATSALVVHTGSRAVQVDRHAQRLAREALFLLVFGTRPAIHSALLHRLQGPARD